MTFISYLHVSISNLTATDWAMIIKIHTLFCSCSPIILYFACQGLDIVTVEIRCSSTSQIPSTSTLLHYSSDNNTPSIVFISILFFDQTYFFCYLIWLFCLLFVRCFIVLLVAAWLMVAREYSVTERGQRNTEAVYHLISFNFAIGQ